MKKFYFFLFFWGFLILKCSAQVNSFPYSENWENGDGGWVGTFVSPWLYGSPCPSSASIWQLGNPTSKWGLTAHSGSNSWTTNLSGVYSNDRLYYLTSPQFDLSGLSNPKLEFWMAYEIEFGWDEAYVEYSVNNGAWTRLGNFQSSTWYSTNYAVGGSPLTSAYYRWTGTYLSWKKYSIDLTSLISPNVRFRIVLATDWCEQFRGVLIDDFTILENSSISNSIPKTNLCRNESIVISFTANGAYNSSNTFTAQLSDATGSFAAPTDIGSMNTTTSGTINATIPANISAGTGYRVRVVSSDPVVTGSDNGSDITINEQPSATITPNGPTTFCPGSSVKLIASSGSSWLWSIGATTQEITVTQTGDYSVTVTNASNCSATSPVTTITVKDDEAPLPDIATLPDLTDECSVNVSTYPTATDNCKGTVTAATDDPLSYTAQGDYVIHWKYDDGNGNVTTQEQNIKIHDVTPPYFDAIADQIIIMNPATCKGKVPNLIVGLHGTDNCGDENVYFTQSIPEGEEYNTSHGASETVIVTAHDGHGNEFSREVKLISKDDAAPTFTCPPAQNVTLTNNCSIVVPDLIALITDGDAHCGTIHFTQNPVAGTPISSSHHSTQTVTIIADDGNGNSISCNVILTAVDQTPPVLQLPDNIHQSNDIGVCNAAVTVTTPSASDNCAGTTVNGARDDGKALNASYPVGTTIITWRATDAAGLTDTYQQTVTVTDNEKPHVITKNISKQLSHNGTVTITAADVDNGSWDNCGIQTMSVSPNSFDCSNLGANTVILTVTDVHGSTETAIATVTITALQSTTTVSVSPGTQQYSDRVSFETTIDPGSVTGGCIAATSATFMIGAQNMGTANFNLEADGKLHARLNNVALFEDPDSYELSPGTKTVTAIINGKNAAFIITDPTTSLVITRENARADYTGAQFIGTSCASCNTATVLLSATIRDIAAVTGSGDPDRGDIRKARVKFIDRDNNADISGWLTPVLVNPSDIKTGTVVFEWKDVSIGNSDAQQFTVGMVVEGEINASTHAYYIRNNSEDNTVITIARPLNDFITGGGYLILEESSGIKSGDEGSKNNFGFNVKYNKSKTNLQGNINTIVRRTEVDDNQLHVYQIKGNKMTSLLATSATSASPGKATFNGNASIQDITYTDPTTPEYKTMYKPSAICPDCYGDYSPSVDGGALLQVVMTDRGEPGNMDGIAITVWNKDGGLWYASNWNGVNTAEQILSGGNLRVNAGSTNTGTVANTLTLSSTKNPSDVGDAVTFKAIVVESNSATPTGYITFTDGSTVLATAPVSTSANVSSASFTISALTVGSHSIMAYYNGDNKFASSAASLTQFVNSTNSYYTLRAKTEETIEAKAKPYLNIEAWPNPAPHSFRIGVKSNNTKEKIVLRVIDMYGRVIETKANVQTGEIKLGENYRPGTYLIEAIQGGQKKTVKLVKLSE